MKRNNRGFTLVELIIVVAIIAVLAAVLAPQYLQYVEKSRQSNDLQVATNYMRAATVAMADRNTGLHTNTNDWMVFKWGYNTGNTGAMNMHIGAATVVAGVPTGIDTGKRDAPMQEELAKIMGWTNAAGEPDTAFITRPQSAAGAQAAKGGNYNSFIFFINSRTGELLVSREYSEDWVTEIGVNAPLTA